MNAVGAGQEVARGTSAGQARQQGLADLASQGVEEKVVTGRTLLHLKGEDYVHPALSPDARRLAVGKVIVEEGAEGTEVAIFDLTTGVGEILLSREAANELAVYKAFVTGLSWIGAHRLLVEISDGDVGVSRRTFDVETKRVVESEQRDILMLQPLPEGLSKAKERLSRLYPEFPPEAVSWDDITAPILVGDQAIILQKSLAGHDSDLWLYDLTTASTTRLLAIPDQALLALRGGVSVGGSAIVLLSHDAEATLLLHKDGKMRKLATVRGTRTPPYLNVRQASGDAAYFQIRAHTPSQRGNNPLYEFDGSTVSQIIAFPELYDVDVNAAGDLFAFCVWDKDKRSILVKRLE